MLAAAVIHDHLLFLGWAQQYLGFFGRNSSFFLCVFIALATRCYCNTDAVMVKWSQQKSGSSAWRSGCFCTSGDAPSELLGGWPENNKRSIGCCGEAQTTSPRNWTPEKRTWRRNSTSCSSGWNMGEHWLHMGMMLLATSCQWKTKTTGKLWSVAVLKKALIERDIKDNFILGRDTSH